MLKTEPGSTTAMPIWLAVLTLSMFALRFGLGVYEHYNPPKAIAAIAWQDPDVKPGLAIRDRPILYDFCAEWCVPCQQMENGPLANQDIIPFVNEHFTACKVVDRKKEAGLNSQAVQALQDKYSILGFPEFIVTSPSGLLVNTHSGPASAAQFQAFLDESILLTKYTRAKESVLANQPARAAQEFVDFIQSTKWKHARCVAACGLGYVCYLQSGEEQKAQELLNTGLDKCKDSENHSGYATLRYFAKQIDLKELMKQANESMGDRCSVHADLGQEAFARKNYDQAKIDFQWAYENAPKDWFDYKVAKLRLADIEKIKGAAK